MQIYKKLALTNKYFYFKKIKFTTIKHNNYIAKNIYISYFKLFIRHIYTENKKTRDKSSGLSLIHKIF